MSISVESGAEGETENAPNRRAGQLVQALGYRSIVLIGLMGSGKTSTGRRLAQMLNLPFADADAEIEAAAGMSISEIFARHGEPYFRDGEAPRHGPPFERGSARSGNRRRRLHELKRPERGLPNLAYRFGLKPISTCWAPGPQDAPIVRSSKGGSGTNTPGTPRSTLSGLCEGRHHCRVARWAARAGGRRR